MSDSDCNNTRDARCLLSSKYLIKWFAENATFVHDKIVPIILGMNFFTDAQAAVPEDTEESMRQSLCAAKPLLERPRVVYCQFNLHTHYSRRDVS